MIINATTRGLCNVLVNQGCWILQSLLIWLSWGANGDYLSGLLQNDAWRWDSPDRRIDDQGLWMSQNKLAVAATAK